MKKIWLFATFLFLISKIMAFESLSLETTYQITDLHDYFLQNLCPNLKLSDYRCKKNLLNLKYKYGFKDTMIHNELAIESINAYRLEYTTRGVNDDPKEVSAAVLIPNINPAKIRGFILFYHGTTLNKSTAPSNFLLAGTANISKDLAASYASLGYIVVAPDYIGLGKDLNSMHPFVYFPKVNALDGITALISVRKLLDQQKISLSAETAPLNIIGFSEGGAYALWASKLLQNQESNKLALLNLNLKQTIGMSGPYDVSHTQVPFLTSNTTDSCWLKNKFFSDSYTFYPECFIENNSTINNIFHIGNSIISAKAKPFISTFALFSYAYYHENKNYFKYFMPAYFKLNCLRCKISNQHYTMEDLFLRDNSQLADLDSIMLLYQSALDMARKSNKNNYDQPVTIRSYLDPRIIIGLGNIGLNNSILSFVQPTVIKDQELIKTAQNADIYQWYTNNPITLIYLTADSIVTPLNSLVAAKNILPHSLVTAIPVKTSFSPLRSDLDAGFAKLPGISYEVATGLDHQDSLAPLLAISSAQLSKPTTSRKIATPLLNASH